MRMGIHTGSVVAGVVGTKIPHYSVFGETVEIAGIMEASGEPMRIQVCKTNHFQCVSFSTFYFLRFPKKQEIT